MHANDPSDDPPTDDMLDDFEPEFSEEFDYTETPEDLEEYEALSFGPPVAPDETKLPRAVDWRGKRVAGAEHLMQHSRWGAFADKMPRGLCLHYPVHAVWLRKGTPGSTDQERLKNGVARKVAVAIAFARNLTRSGFYNTYYILDYLGQHHQDCNISDHGIHGHTANKYTQGVEISGAGKLREFKGQFYRSFDVTKNAAGATVLRNASQPPVPAWARRTVSAKQGNIRPGTYVLFTPGQVEGICRLHADLMFCDRDRGIYRSKHELGVSGVTSHDLHSDQKVDVGGSLFTDVETFGDLLDRYIRAVRADGPLENLVDEGRHAAAFAEVIAQHPEYAAAYAQWQPDALPVWA